MTGPLLRMPDPGREMLGGGGDVVIMQPHRPLTPKPALDYWGAGFVVSMTLLLLVLAAGLTRRVRKDRDLTPIPVKRR